MSRTLRLFEHGKLHVTESGEGIRPHEFDALVRFNDRHGGEYFAVGHKHIKARQFVGYVEVGELSIEILPKADRNGSESNDVWSTGLLEMLRIALGLRLDQLPSASQQVSRNRLLDLIAQAYVAELELLLREGLAKGYRTTQSNGCVFRGRLKIAEHLRDNVARADRFFVEYQTFDRDIAINQLLAAALEVLSWSAMSPSIGCTVEACLGRFPEVRLARATNDAFDRIQLTRATQRYATALVYARMILSSQGPQLKTGDERVFALLFDMNALWERYIAVLVRRAAPENLAVSTQERCLFWTPQGHGVRKVKPDIVVRERVDRDPGKTLLVIDTKWKVPSNGLPSDDDLKQMFVYNELLGGARSMLLYPATSKSFSASGMYASKQHGCEQRHVGLFEKTNWSTSKIKQQLQKIVEEVAPACGL
jgi:5-methylcytosine-specific restriction enzyme subunit McrC